MPNRKQGQPHKGWRAAVRSAIAPLRFYPFIRDGEQYFTDRRWDKIYGPFPSYGEAKRKMTELNSQQTPGA